MNYLIETGVLSELTYGNNFSYILDDASMFSATNYKVLQNHDDSCFAKCMKLLFNGKTQFYYLTGANKPFSLMLPQLDSESFLAIVMNLFKSVLEVKNNGFLTCKNIDISFDHIYVDQNTHKVYLIYVPITTGFFADQTVFENELRASIAKSILGYATLSSPGTTQLFAKLQNAMVSIEDIVNGKSNIEADDDGDIQDSKYSTLKLISVNSAVKVSLVMDKDEYLVGRSKKSSDGVILDNKMIGRMHCKIIRKAQGYVVEDLKSVNGTYLNCVRLQPHMEAKLQNGDILRLANLDMKVVIE